MGSVTIANAPVLRSCKFHEAGTSNAMPQLGKEKVAGTQRHTPSTNRAQLNKLDHHARSQEDPFDNAQLRDKLCKQTTHAASALQQNGREWHSRQGKLEAASVGSCFSTEPPRPRQQFMPSSTQPKGDDQHLFVKTEFERSGEAAESADVQRLDAIMAESSPGRVPICTPGPAIQSDANGSVQTESLSNVTVTVHTQSRLLTRPPRSACRHATDISKTSRRSSTHDDGQLHASQMSDKFTRSSQALEQSCTALNEDISSTVGRQELSTRSAVASADHTENANATTAKQDIVPECHSLNEAAVKAAFSSCHDTSDRVSDFDDDPIAQLLHRSHRILQAGQMSLQAPPASVSAAPSGQSVYDINPCAPCSHIGSGMSPVCVNSPVHACTTDYTALLSRTLATLGQAHDDFL